MNENRNRESTDGKRHQVKLTREFAFPREAVFDMMTDPKKAVKWFGSPEGAVKVAFELDARPGGVIRLDDRHSDGRVGRTTGSFVEVLAPERISFRTATTMDGGTIPFEALQTMIFEELGLKRTRLTILVEILATGTFPGGAQALAEGYKGGWGETLDRLQGELARPRADR